RRAPTASSRRSSSTRTSSSGCTRKRRTSGSRTRRRMPRRCPGTPGRWGISPRRASRSSSAGAMSLQPQISDEALKRAEEMIEQEEGVQNRFKGAMAGFVTAVAVAMSLFHLYASYSIVRTEVLRATHVAFVLFLSFMIFPVARRFRHRTMWWDWACALLGVAIAAYLVSQGDDFWDRSITPDGWDIFFGVALALLILEAMRRATGWIMPVITVCFLLYALYGPYLPAPWTHKGYE